MPEPGRRSQPVPDQHLALTLEVCREIHDLDFRSDPVDELIAATSLIHDIALLTRDSEIRVSKVVPLVSWRS